MRGPNVVIVGATGWFGRTLVHEYIDAFGMENADRLCLAASRPTTLELRVASQNVSLPVSALSALGPDQVARADVLCWYSFVLKNRLGELGPDRYRSMNTSIAEHVFALLESRPELPCIFASSGAVLQYDAPPAYAADPYSNLKMLFAHRLNERENTTVLYPFAVTGAYLNHPDQFALGSFISQALSQQEIVVEAKGPIIRSYGSAHDLSRYLLQLLGQERVLPSSIVPVTHTLDLVQLAVEVASVLDGTVAVRTRMQDTPAEVYATRDFEYARQLAAAGLAPSTLADQIRHTALGPAFAR